MSFLDNEWAKEVHRLRHLVESLEADIKRLEDELAVANDQNTWKLYAETLNKILQCYRLQKTPGSSVWTTLSRVKKKLGLEPTARL